MAGSNELYIVPEQIRNYSNKIQTYADMIDDELANFVAQMQSTEITYQAQSATEMREKFESIRATLEKYAAHLRKIAAFLNQAVAEPAEVVEQVAVQNVASIHKPD